jgi:hypothetical protein
MLNKDQNSAPILALKKEGKIARSFMSLEIFILFISIDIYSIHRVKVLLRRGG